MTTTGKTILYVLNKSKEYLQKKNIPNPRLDAEVILSDILGLERIKLYSNFEKILSIEEEDIYRKKIQDRGLLKPVAYITQKKMFYNSFFYVDENVLIPRPETEELVEWFLKTTSANGKLTVLDLCSGSGCIGISVKKERPDYKIYFSDISKRALDITKINSKNILDEDIIEEKFIESNLWTNIPESLMFNEILSNPPYIPESEKPEIMADVLKYEPEIALFLRDPENFYSKLLQGAENHLNDSGSLFMETHPDWINRLSEMSKLYHLETVEIKKDLSGKERFIRLMKRGI